MKESVRRLSSGDTADLIVELFEVYPLKDQVEILANVFLRIGVTQMEREGVPFPDGISQDKILDIVLRDVKYRGETLGNVLAHQGLITLTWLE